MRKKQNNRKRLILSVIMLALILSISSTVNVKAAVKTKIIFKEIGVGLNATEKIHLENEKKDAEYTYSSNNKSVVTVNQKGEVKGRGFGTAQITVFEEWNGKKNAVGTVTVNVKKAVINHAVTKKVYSDLTTQPGYYKENPKDFYKDLEYTMQYYNPKATYQFYSCDEEILTISLDGVIQETKKAGKAKVKIKEVYEGKTRTVGKLTVSVEEPRLSENGTLNPVVPKGEILDVEAFFKCLPGDYYVYISESSEELTNDNRNVLEFKMTDDNFWYGEIYAAEVGTEYIHVWAYDYVKKDFTIYLGYITVRVEESSVLEDFWFEWEEMGGFYEYDSKEGLVIEKGDRISPYLVQQPVCYRGEYSITSSNPEVVSVEIDSYPVSWIFRKPMEHHSGEIEFDLKAKKVGTAIITIEAEGIKREFKVTVKEASEEK